MNTVTLIKRSTVKYDSEQIWQTINLSSWLYVCMGYDFCRHCRHDKLWRAISLSIHPRFCRSSVLCKSILFTACILWAHISSEKSPVVFTCSRHGIHARSLEREPLCCTLGLYFQAPSLVLLLPESQMDWQEPKESPRGGGYSSSKESSL